ncbi:MFS transporter [Rhodococcus rhodnii]|uniref:Major facilitator superfamily multidrug n=2 Tax=Rhodococcus rhodnii TaxID=38312 RepID=R7WTJ8_9NOCA|nr:MFS transporter [Rhodococcus rhodnii]EOM77469.1 major facilitator superfamily multidrug [Rhodococcus rhodnii LMG 5362]TXG90344.1 MFS transporter [Rhodococcus rhodnii]
MSAARPERRIVPILAFAGIVAALMQTLIVPLVPALPTLLDTSPSTASWAVTATLLAGAVTTPIAGRVGDMIGKKPVVIACLTSLTIGSVVCALATSAAPFVVGRALQGAGIGTIALGISIMRDRLPAERVGSAIAVMSATLGVGGAVGTPVAALVAERAHWHVVFWGAAAFGVVAIVATTFGIAADTVRAPARFDVVGAVGLAVGLVSVLLVITKIGEWGATSPTIVGAAVTAAVVFALWGRHQWRRRDPVVDLRLCASRPVLFTNLASIAVGFTLFGMSLIPMQVLMAPRTTGYGLELTMLEAGLVMGPAGLVMFAFSPVSAACTRRFGPRATLGLGAVVLGIGYAVMFAMNLGVAAILVSTMVIGAGIGIAFGAMPALIMAAVPVSETAAAMGLNSLMRSIGTSTSAAVISAILAGMTMDAAGGQLPSSAAFAVAIGVSIAAAVVTLLLVACIPKRAVVATPSLPPLPVSETANRG